MRRATTAGSATGPDLDDRGGEVVVLGRRPARVVVAEDHTLVREVIVATLDEAADFDVVADVGHGDRVLRAVHETHPDVVLLDIGLPGRDGLEVAARLREETPTVRVVFLTVHDDLQTIRRAMALRVDGYMTKIVAMDELLEGLRRVVHGGTFLSPFIADRIVAMAGGTADPDALTLRELEILQQLADGQTAGDIAAELYVSVKTVRNHLTNIYAKLRVHGATQAAAEGRRRGLVRSA